jgi:mono/diheme cytochrome c family protein
MKQLCLGTAVFGAALVAAPVLGYAQDVDIGKLEYDNSCAVCHGVSGKGDGPLAASLKKPPTDLTKIQKNKVGLFPFDRLYEVIDGRQGVEAHGPRDMPVWGSQYIGQAVGSTGGFGITLKDRESFVRGRIIALIGYIYTLQAK